MNKSNTIADSALMKMPTDKYSTIFSQHELLSNGKSHITASFNNLHVTRMHQIADFDLLNEYFRTDHFSIMLITKGTVNASVNFHPFLLHQNSLAVTSPHAIKQIVSASASAEGVVVMFTPDMLTQAGITKRSHDLLNYFGTNGLPNWELQPEDASGIHLLMENLLNRCEAANSHRYGKEQLYHTFAIFLYEVAAQSIKYAQPSINKLTRKEDLVVRFAELVGKHVREHRKVQFYAELLHVTAKYLTETVKEVSGKSAGEVIDDFVIRECKLLLEKPEYSVSQISSLMNFADPSFFGKYFKRLTGLSPKEFRTNLFA